jgi:thiosulfate/3-mercaptopyruvate sulfurtransferase
MSNWLIETAELAEMVASEPDADRVILDCTWHLPDSGKQGRDDFRKAHIPGARFVDLTAVSDPDSPYVNMLPDADQFASEIGALGIGNETNVIVYDSGYVSARLWWMFRTFGHDNVRILNGGLRKWMSENRPTESGDSGTIDARDFAARPQGGRVATTEDILEAGQSGSAEIIDARTAAKFDGHEGSGYPGVASGYMPGAINTPWQLFFNPAPDHTFISPEQAQQIFAERGVDLDKPVFTTCGSGVTASILGFMLEEIGHTNWRLYDGSWHEWGQRKDTPKLVKPRE